MIFFSRFRDFPTGKKQTKIKKEKGGMKTIHMAGLSLILTAEAFIGGAPKGVRNHSPHKIKKQE